MALSYQAVGWNRQKRRYDAVLAAFVVLWLAVFAGAGALLRPEATLETLLIRGLGTCAFFLLNVVLAIGPLARLDRRFLPLLYNRRHLGVTTFLVGLAHATFTLIQFHAAGDVNPFVSLLAGNTRFLSLAQFPFELLGVLALIVLFLMAATSHDFWLKTLGPRAWKTLHMLVYAAYALLVMHVVLGVLQAERAPFLAAIPFVSLAALCALHLLAARREARVDAALRPAPAAGFVDACALADLAPDVGRVVALGPERIALFRHAGGVSAVSNVCRHQNGPLGEGRIVAGCITCPWHGYQYRPADGCAPPPFTERLETYRVRVENGRILVDPRALPPGTPVEPAPAVGVP